MGLFGCGAVKYKLEFGGYGFESKKTSYAEGETVTVTYDMIATDTDYTFYTDSDDVKLDQEFDNNHGYVFTFTMPPHDVKLSVRSRSTMEMDPDAHKPAPADDPKDYITNENMVFDYYEATVATVGGDESTEYVLYKFDDTQLILARYDQEEDSEETMNYCLVSSSVLDDCMKLVKKYKMQKWKKGSGLRGMIYVVKFMNDGEMIRVSSDSMPDDGREAFYAIRGVLAGEWGGASRSLNPVTWFCPECGTKNEGAYCSECGLKKPEEAGKR